MHTRRFFGGILLGLCVNVTLVWGQESRAIISGAVTDPQGAAVAAVNVEVRNMETNVVSTVQTNERGVYTTPPLNPGRYAVSASATGFKMTVRSNIELRVADRMLLDFELELGMTTETVTITAEAPLLETGSSSRSTTLNTQLVASLPTYARNVFELVRYTAGVRGGTRGSWGQRPFDNGDGGVSILGGASGTNEVLLDGSPFTYRESGTPGDTVSPPPDAVGEVKILTNVYDAEYGRTGGGVISLSFRSGTNDYRGAVGWYVRNDVLNANTFESNARGAAKTSFRMHQPVATLSGPIRFPGLYNGRNKTFFMYALDLYRNARPQVSNMIAPTALEKQGDFSQTYVSGTSGPAIMIYDPLTTTETAPGVYRRVLFPNSRIAPSRIDPVAAKILPVFLSPDRGITARGQPNLLVTPNFDHEPFNSHAFRLDHVLTDKHTFLASITRNNRHQTNGVGLGLSAYQAAGHPYASSSYLHWRINASGSFALTSAFSPTLVSTTRVSWFRHEFAIDNFGFRYNDPATLGFPASQIAQSQTKTFPCITFGIISLIGPCRGGGNVLNFSDTWSVGKSLTRVVGAHNVKFGGDARLMLNNQSSLLPFATFGFTDSFTRENPLVASAASGDGFASFLLGYPGSVSSTWNSLPAQGQRYYGLFFHDDWRVTRKLTLNLGLRWEYESPVTDRFDRFVRGFDPTTVTNLGSPTGPRITGGLLFADSNNRLPHKRDLNNVAPRLGYAYQVGSKLVLRGGWGVTYDPTATVAPMTGFSLATAPSTSVGGAGREPITTPGCTGNACGMLSNPFNDGILLPLGRSLGLQTNVGASISYVWPDRSVPYAHTFSTGIQYQLPLRSVLQVSYDGRRGRQSPTSRALNTVTYEQYLTHGANLTATATMVANPFAGLLPGTALNGATMTRQQSLLPYPQFTGITETGRSIGTTRYDALLVQLEKRLSAGLTVLFTATFAKGTTYSTYLNSGMDAIGQFIRRDSGDEPYIINLNGTYSLPFFNNAGGLTKALLGGWNVAGFGQWRAGSILTVGGATSSGLDPAIPNPTYQRWFNTCTFNMNTNRRQMCASDTEPVAWIIQRPFTLLTAPQPQWGSLRSSMPLLADLSLYKTFKTEHMSIELRADASNALNTPRFGNPNLSATASLFGVTTLTQANMPRSVQFGLRLSF